jgi:hypothetical protein
VQTSVCDVVFQGRGDAVTRPLRDLGILRLADVQRQRPYDAVFRGRGNVVVQRRMDLDL